MEIQVHGALVDVMGVGVLLRGPSGIGKSECALELVRRGHRLVADDLVRIQRAPGATELVGSAPELIRHFMEIRGIGLLHIPDLYGGDAVAVEGPVSLVIHLEAWREDADYERVGLERQYESLAGVEVPSLIFPLRPAASMATLVEAAVRDDLRRQQGASGAETLNDRLKASADAKAGFRG